MISFNESDKAYLETLIRRHQSNKPIFNNYFFANLDNVIYYESADTLILKKRFELYNRIYFLSSNQSKLTEILSKLSTNDIINIPSKRKLSDELINVLYNSDYNLFEVYERMNNDNVDARGDFDASFADHTDVNFIYDLLMDNFNPYTDTLPSKEEIQHFIKRKWILVSRNDDNKVVGTLLLRFEPQKCYFYIWVSTGSFSDSLNLFLNGFNYMHTKGYEKAYLWVRESNAKPRKLYQTLGFKFDGLKDYTFTKKQ